MKNPVREYCEKAGVSAKQLAEMTGMNEAAVEFIANDLHLIAKSKSALKLAEIIGVTVDELFSRDAAMANRKQRDDLADEIYAITRSARLAKFSLNELMRAYFDKSEDETVCTQEFMTCLLVGYLDAQARADIANDYIVGLVKDLEALETMARGE